MSEYVKPVAASLLPHVGGLLGGFITRKNIKNWYEHLKKPDWRPPNWAFGPVWSVLYTSMGYASYLVWRDGGGFEGEARNALALYGTQLALNWAWTPIFFQKKNLMLAFFEICGLWGCVAGCIYMFHPINSTASYLMIPYLGWLTLASALNYRVWIDNPSHTIKDKST